MSGYARVGHGGQAGGATYNPFIMELIAGRDINITTNVGEAEVVNENGPLTLVVDDLFPAFPDLGPGAFNLNSLIAATGELRIYTSRQSQNTVNDTINGATFTPGTFDVDTSTEQWSIYFSAGIYEGDDFKFYYKDPIVFPTTPPNIPSRVAREFFADVAANLVELAGLLPIVEVSHAPYVFLYS